MNWTVQVLLQSGRGAFLLLKLTFHLQNDKESYQRSKWQVMEHHLINNWLRWTGRAADTRMIRRRRRKCIMHILRYVVSLVTCLCWQLKYSMVGNWEWISGRCFLIAVQVFIKFISISQINVFIEWWTTRDTKQENTVEWVESKTKNIPRGEIYPSTIYCYGRLAKPNISGEHMRVCRNWKVSQWLRSTLSDYTNKVWDYHQCGWNRLQR